MGSSPAKQLEMSSSSYEEAGRQVQGIQDVRKAVKNLAKWSNSKFSKHCNEIIHLLRVIVKYTDEITNVNESKELSEVLLEGRIVESIIFYQRQVFNDLSYFSKLGLPMFFTLGHLICKFPAVCKNAVDLSIHRSHLQTLKYILSLNEPSSEMKQGEYLDLVPLLLIALRHILVHENVRNDYNECGAVEILLKYQQVADVSLTIRFYIEILLPHLLDIDDGRFYYTSKSSVRFFVNLLTDCFHRQKHRIEVATRNNRGKINVVRFSSLVDTWDLTEDDFDDQFQDNDDEDYVHERQGLFLTLDDLLGCINCMVGDEEITHRLINLGLIPLLVKILCEVKGSERELDQALVTVCHISFVDIANLQSNDKFLTRIKELVECENSAIQLKAKCILRHVCQSDERQQIISNGATDQTILMSFHGDSVTNKAQQIRQKLNDNNFKVWMSEDLSGSSKDYVNSGVENAVVILIIVTRTYRDCPICRAEANDAARLGKTIIPILVEQPYNGDGWLGDMIKSCGQTTIPMTTDKEFHSGIQMLMKELDKCKHDYQNSKVKKVSGEALSASTLSDSLKNDAKATKEEPGVTTKEELVMATKQEPAVTTKQEPVEANKQDPGSNEASSEEKTDLAASNASTATGVANKKNKKSSSSSSSDTERSFRETNSNAMKVSRWSGQQVKTWLEHNKLQRYSEKFQDTDGEKLLKVRDISINAPEFFYRKLCKSFGISILDRVQFAVALEKLYKH